MSIFLKTGRVRAEWADYNGHMNLAYYILLFDGAWEKLLGKFNIGEEAAKIEKRTTFAVESHTTYDQELKVGDEVDLNLLFLDRDKKRIVYKLEMIHKEKREEFFIRLLSLLFFLLVIIWPQIILKNLQVSIPLILKKKLFTQSYTRKIKNNYV